MRLVLSRLQAHILPLTSVRFGSRMSHRSFHRLHEAIPQSTLQTFFPEYENHTQLAKAISSERANRRKEPNRWQTHIPRIRRIRQLLENFIYSAHAHVRNYGYLDGLQEYVARHNIEFWHADPQGGGLFYTHEYQYLYGLREFLVREEYHELAARVQQLLQCVFEQPGDLWAIVYTILGRLNPPTFEFELQCDFQPRTDDAARQKCAQFATYGTF